MSLQPITSVRRVRCPVLGPAAFESPLAVSEQSGDGVNRFVPDDLWVRARLEVRTEGTDGADLTVRSLPGPYDEPQSLPSSPADSPIDEELLLEKAGPRRQLYFDPKTVTAAMVTCGGLCPGLNNVIRSLFLELRLRYGVARVLGVRGGYRGLNRDAAEPPLELTLDQVSWIHKEGGTMLGSSRGAPSAEVMVDALAAMGVNILFCIGGDGTQRGAQAIYEEVTKRGLNIAIVGIPKTIDNDISYCDRTFGFSSAIERAHEVVHLAHTEAKGAPYGVGLVKLMGRDSGFIACGATLACQEVNFTLIPESPFALEGPHGFLNALDQRLRSRGHAVIVVAEGAGQHLFPETQSGRDASGNRKYGDIGLYLKDIIGNAFRGGPMDVNVKYIDPSYIIRSVCANATDSLLCDQFARRAVHTALSGRTGVVIGFIHGKFVNVPIPMAAKRRRVDLAGDLWTSVLASTGQPARFFAD